MAKKKHRDNIEHPTDPANLSQNKDEKRNVPIGMDKRAGQGSK